MEFPLENLKVFGKLFKGHQNRETESMSRIKEFFRYLNCDNKSESGLGSWKLICSKDQVSLSGKQ